METLSNIANIVKNIAQVTTALTAISTGLGLTKNENASIESDNNIEVLSANTNKKVPNININFIVTDENKLPAFSSVNSNNCIDSKFNI